MPDLEKLFFNRYKSVTREHVKYKYTNKTVKYTNKEQESLNRLS